MRRVVFIAMLSVGLLVQSASAEITRSVSVRGHSEIEVEPDIATVQMGIFVFDNDLLKAKKEADAKIASILNAFKKLEVKANDIQTTQLHVKPKFKEVNESWQFVGYEVTRSVTVTVRQISQLNEFLDKSLEAGANRMEAISLSSSKEQELAEQVLTQSMNDAKRRAARLAEGFGAKLGKVVSIESATHGSGDVRYNILFDAPAFGESTFHPGRIKIDSDVDVVFELMD